MLRDADATGGVALRIGVEEQSAPFGDGERGGEVDGRRGLSDAALLVGDSYNMGHGGCYFVSALMTTTYGKYRCHDRAEG